MKEKKLRLLDIQMASTIVFIIATIVSIILTYNEKLKIQNKKTLFDIKTFNNIIIANRTLILLLVLIYLYIDYSNYKLDMISNQNTKPDKLQLYSSILSVIAAIIILYSVSKYKDDPADVSNPTL